MSFKCSIFGHNYGDSEVEREREEDGSEVVITIRETETCTRCGEVRVVSENKEVTTLETAADIVADDLGDDASAGAPEARAADHQDEPAGASEDSQSPSVPSNTEQPSGETQTGDVEIPDAEGTEIDSADHPEDDAVILDDDEDDDDEREPGEWPDEAEDDQPATAEPTVPVDDEREPGEWPDGETGEESEENWDLPPEVEPHPETEQPTVESTSSAITVPEGEFYCPNCGFSTPVDSSSLRAGDFCPECHQTTLEHHEE